jgi:peptide/nickel transport system substrate-binding protein
LQRRAAASFLAKADVFCESAASNKKSQPGRTRMSEDYEHPYIPKLKQLLVEERASRREFLRTATLLGVSATTAYAFADKVAPAAWSGKALAALAKGGSLRIGMPVDEVTRPFTINSPQQSNITRQVLDFLTVTGRDNITRPFLLERWTASEDLKTWTLFVRKDVTWRSGRKFTGDDVSWNLKFALDEKNGSSSIGLMRGYLVENYDGDDGKKHSRFWDSNAIERVDDFTIRLHLKAPKLAMPELLFHYALPMMEPGSNGLFAPGVDGTGAFELVEHEPRRRVVYRARKNYWGPGPYLDSFEFVDLGDDPNASIAALAAKQIDGLYEGDTEQIDILNKLPDVKVYKVGSAATGIIRGKVAQKPFDDDRVRQALRMALDPAAAVAVAVHGLGAPGEHHHVSPSQADYAKLPPFKHDVAAAQKLLADAGYPNGLDLELNVPAQYGYLVKMAQAAVEQWRAANIRVSLKMLPAAQYAEAWDKVTFGITRWSHRPLASLNLSLAYRSNGPFNDSGWANPKFDEALAKVEATLDLEKRRQYVAECERILQEEGPFAQPIWKDNFTAMDKRVANFEMHPTSFIFAKDLAVAS